MSFASISLHQMCRRLGHQLGLTRCSDSRRVVTLIVTVRQGGMSFAIITRADDEDHHNEEEEEEEEEEFNPRF